MASTTTDKSAQQANLNDSTENKCTTNGSVPEATPHGQEHEEEDDDDEEAGDEVAGANGTGKLGLRCSVGVQCTHRCGLSFHVADKKKSNLIPSTVKAPPRHTKFRSCCSLCTYIN